MGSLEDSVKTQRLELETLRAHLSENRNTIDQYKKDKQTLYQGKSEPMAPRGYPVGVWGGASSPPLEKNKPPVSPADYKRQQKGGNY